MIDAAIIVLLIAAVAVNVAAYRKLMARVLVTEQVGVALEALVRKANERASAAYATSTSVSADLDEEVRLRQAGDQQISKLTARQGRILADHVESNLHTR